MNRLHLISGILPHIVINRKTRIRLLGRGGVSPDMPHHLILQKQIGMVVAGFSQAAIFRRAGRICQAQPAVWKDIKLFSSLCFKSGRCCRSPKPRGIIRTDFQNCGYIFKRDMSDIQWGAGTTGALVGAAISFLISSIRACKASGVLETFCAV
jgi:hypothetical protein